MTAGYAQSADNVRVRGLNGGGVLSFEGDVKHGHGKRRVAVHVTPATILDLAAALCCCPGSIDQPAHAVWHLESPHRPRPCPGKSGRDEASLPHMRDTAQDDARALVQTERALVLNFLREKLAAFEHADVLDEEAYAVGYLRGLIDAVAAGEHARP